MIYELQIDEGKEKSVINFLKQLDFVTVKPIKKKPAKHLTEKGKDLAYFGACPDWEMDVLEIRKQNTTKRTDGWL